MYILDTSLQFGLLIKAQTIPFGSQERSQIQILISVIPIIFGYNIGHQRPLIIWMLKHTRGGTLLVVLFGIRTRGLILFGPYRLYYGCMAI